METNKAKIIRILKENKEAFKTTNVDTPKQSEESIGVAKQIEDIIDQAFIAGQDTSRLVEDDGFHPSSLGIKAGKCGRRNVYLLRGTQRSPSTNARLQRIFGNGNDVHERIQKAMELYGDINWESEIPIYYDDPPVRGHADSTFILDGVPYVGEIKSCSHTVFENRLMFNKPKPEHFVQPNIYAYILNIKKIAVIYENKSTQEIKVFVLDADYDEAEKQLAKWRAEWLCYQDGKLPKRPYKLGSPTCAECDLKALCWGEGQEEGVSMSEYKKQAKSS